MGFWALSYKHEGTRLRSFMLSLQPLIRSSLLHEWKVCFQIMWQNVSAKYRAVLFLQGTQLEAGARANFVFLIRNDTKNFLWCGWSKGHLIHVTRASKGEGHSISPIRRKSSPENHLCKRKAGSLTPRESSHVFEKGLSVGRKDASSNTQV